MGRPKQFIELLGEPTLLHTLRAFENSPEIGRIYVVGDRERVEELASEGGITKYAGCAAPGPSRSLSARSGLSMCEGRDETVVLIHDGSRCLVSPDLIGRVVEAARTVTREADGVIPTLPVSDTIKVAEDGAVLGTLDRAKLHATQTPQAFRLGLLRRVHAAPDEFLRSATDDASLVERGGGRVALVPGERTNIKLTSPEDLILAEAILISRGVRS
jgi:2-C-methyl-D-erythritol 4-phosphate cytidylyltransferase